MYSIALITWLIVPIISTSDHHKEQIRQYRAKSAGQYKQYKNKQQDLHPAFTPVLQDRRLSSVRPRIMTLADLKEKDTLPELQSSTYLQNGNGMQLEVPAEESQEMEIPIPKVQHQHYNDWLITEIIDCKQEHREWKKRNAGERAKCLFFMRQVIGRDVADNHVGFALEACPLCSDDLQCTWCYVDQCYQNQCDE